MKYSRNEESKAKLQIGVLTFHYTTNYGGVLQAYALSNLIKKNGFSCEVIDYRQPSALKVYARTLFLSRYFVSGLAKAFRFNLFIRKMLDLSKKVVFCKDTLSRFCKNYDVVIVGSDEVWKTDSFRGYDPAFFLSFLGSTKKRISFSASLGTTRSFGKKRDEICMELQKFSSVSVRDARSNEVLLEECGFHAEKFLDPTLLIDDWDEMLSPVKLDPYVLIYGKLTADELGMVRAIAKRKGCMIVSVGERNFGVDKNCIMAGPAEWLSYFNSARIVFTTFFHGAIFSLKFHQEVFVIRREDKSYKIDQLMDDLALIVDENDGLWEEFENYNMRRYRYSEHTAALIDQGRLRATRYLVDAIGLDPDEKIIS